MLRRSVKIADNMTIRREKMMENLSMTKGLILAEPVQLALQVYCIKKNLDIDTHEYVRKLSDKAVNENVDFLSIIKDDNIISDMLTSLSITDRTVLLSPEKYIGTVEEDIEYLTNTWETQLNEIENRIKQHIENTSYL